jgi:hypothetical protein
MKREGDKTKIRVTSIKKGTLKLLGFKSLDDGKRQITLNIMKIHENQGYERNFVTKKKISRDRISKVDCCAA